jgi:TRAP-type mannitol/chloroaromatic compound transport system permease large subunit
VTLGLLTLPALLRRGYDKGLACGVICASGTLGRSSRRASSSSCWPTS